MTIKNGFFYLSPDLLNRVVNVVVIGAGGSGSHMVSDLAVLHQSMIDLGHPGGLSCTAIDADIVTNANVGRAKFFQSDVGVNKAAVIVNRVNISHGLNWTAVDGMVDERSDHSLLRQADLVIGAVDTPASRRAIRAVYARLVRYNQRVMWLDLGNGEFDGQVVLGELGGGKGRLPCVTDLFPDLLDPSQDPVDAGPSCSRYEALAKQSAFVNRSASMHAVTMLSVLFRFGRLGHHAVFFNLQSGRSSVIPCSRDAWKRFGLADADSSKEGLDEDDDEDFEVDDLADGHADEATEVVTAEEGALNG